MNMNCFEGGELQPSFTFTELLMTSIIKYLFEVIMCDNMYYTRFIAWTNYAGATHFVK